MSVLAAILDQIETQLDGLAEYIEWMPSGDPDVFPALELVDNGDEPVELEPGVDRRELSLTVVGYVEGGDSKAAHRAIRQLQAEVVDRLRAEPPLSGLVETIEDKACMIDVSELASVRRLAFQQEFAIQFTAVRGARSADT